jgi:hypothetical protein
LPESNTNPDRFVKNFDERLPRPVACAGIGGIATVKSAA